MSVLHRFRLRRRGGWAQSPVLWVMGVACLVEVCLHASRYRVPPPPRELDAPFYSSCQEPATDGPRENAAIVMLARNEEADKAARSVRSIDDKFNRWFQYPIVFLNDEPWTDDFVRQLNATTSAPTFFENVPKAQWTFPSWMDKDAARTSIKDQGDAGILYAGKETYHHMCRFFSG